MGGGGECLSWRCFDLIIMILKKVCRHVCILADHVPALPPFLFYYFNFFFAEL